MKIRIKRSSLRKAEKLINTVKTGCVEAFRTVARTAYLGIRSLIRRLSALPVKTLWIGIGSVFAVLVAVLLFALMRPGKASRETNYVMNTPPADEVLLPDPDIENDPYVTDPSLNGSWDDWTPVSASPAPTPDSGVSDSLPDISETFVTLKNGDDDPAIATVQSRLMELGYMDSDEPTEHYGSLTKHAVSTFQAHNDLDADGVCGLATYTLLMSGSAKAYVMQQGDSGDDVSSVQQRLYELGYLTEKSSITGTFGEKTVSAMKEFQSKNKLTADGKVGDKTLDKLFSDNPVSKFYKVGDTNDVIKTVQKRLKKLGYFSGTATGTFTKATATAIKKFQSQNDLVVDGQLGPSTKEAILSDNAQSYVMQLGDSGSDVKNVQQRLVKLNYLKSSNATGYFGEKTEDAVVAFQSRNKLHADGKIGTGTYNALFSDSAKKAARVATPKPVATPKGSSGGVTSSNNGASAESGSSNSKGVEKMIDVAYTKLGCKYVSGTQGPNTFDCSGFVYYCLKQAGVKVSYATSIAWRNIGKFTKISSLSSCKRGDILVFSGETSAKGHVGIYLGGGKMIDASSSAGCVRVTDTILSGKYWPAHFLMGYRVF